MARLETGTTSKTQAAAARLRRSAPADEGNIQHLVKVLGCLEEIPVSGTRDQRIAQIAARQRGRAARRQLTAAGIRSSAVDRRVETGRLFRIHRGVVAVGHPGPVELGDETAALLAVGDDASLGGITAAVVWGMLSADADDGTIDVIVQRDCRLRHPRIGVHQSRILVPNDIRIHRGLPVLSPARTLLDLAEQTTLRRTELACDRGLVARLLTRADLIQVANRAPTRHGAKVLRQLIDDGPTTVTRSEAEERVLELIRSAELPAPRLNVRLHGFEVDFHWPAHRVVVEVDGFRFHSSRRAFEHDRRKDATLQAAGVTTMRVTWRQLTQEPHAVIARLAGALARAGGD